MAASAVVPFWLTTNVWPAGPPTVGEYLFDVNGVAITIGATVKFVGKVTAINFDPHFGSIQVTGVHPNGKILYFSQGQLPQSQNYQTPNPQVIDQPRAFEPLQLVVGS